MRIVVAPDKLRAGQLVLAGDEHHYLARVRRAAVGDAIELFDNAGRRARAVIVAIGSETLVDASEPAQVVDAPPRIRVLLPWIKGDRMDIAIEKLVEVGADEIVVWPAERAVVQLSGDRLIARIAKLAAQALAATRQSGRATAPKITTASLAEAIRAAPTPRYVLVPGGPPARFHACDKLAIASGPEGGLAPAELDALVAGGFTPIGLGPRVLRAETAPVIAVAIARAATDS